MVVESDGGQVAPGPVEGTVQVGDPDAADTIIATCTGHQGQVHAVAVLPDGSVISAGDNSTVYIWPSAATG